MRRGRGQVLQGAALLTRGREGSCRMAGIGVSLTRRACNAATPLFSSLGRPSAVSFCCSFYVRGRRCWWLSAVLPLRCSRGCCKWKCCFRCCCSLGETDWDRLWKRSTREVGWFAIEHAAGILSPRCKRGRSSSFLPVVRLTQERRLWRDGWTTTRPPSGCPTRADQTLSKRPG